MSKHSLRNFSAQMTEAEMKNYELDFLGRKEK